MFFKVLGASSVLLCYIFSGITFMPTFAWAETIQNAENQKPDTARILLITISGEDSLSGLYSVDENKNITLPLIGEIEIKDKSDAEIQNLLTKSFGQGYLVDPIITVKTKSILKQEKPIQVIEEQKKEQEPSNIYILGAVKNPGKYTLPQDANHILKIVALAGGFSKGTNNKKYEVRRNEQTLVFNDETYIPQTGDIIVVKQHYFWTGNR